MVAMEFVRGGDSNSGVQVLAHRRSWRPWPPHLVNGWQHSLQLQPVVDSSCAPPALTSTDSPSPANSFPLHRPTFLPSCSAVR